MKRNKKRKGALEKKKRKEKEALTKKKKGWESKKKRWETFPERGVMGKHIATFLKTSL